MDTTPKPKQRFRLPEIEQIIIPATQDTPEVAITPASPESSPILPISNPSSNSLQIPSSVRKRATPQWLLDEIAKSTPFTPSTGAIVQPLFASRKNSIAEVKPLFSSRSNSILEVKPLNLTRKRASTAPSGPSIVTMLASGSDPAFDPPPKRVKDDPSDEDKKKKTPFGGTGKKLNIAKPVMVSVSLHINTCCQGLNVCRMTQRSMHSKRCSRT